MGLYKLVDDDYLVFDEPELRGNVHQPSSIHPESDIGFFCFIRKVGKGMVCTFSLVMCLDISLPPIS